ncbi:MAG: DUF1574 domain-containing protein [Leptospiraceae bacterium]|nr:DUF1574 domain-containing protein [Leptospiraceae bacterium]
MIKRKYLLLPFLIFFIAYVLDKILLLERFQTYFTKTLSELNYFHKPVLFDDLKDYLKQKSRKKVLVYLGSSRGLLFNNEYIEKHHPDWILFNFSVPGGTPDYFYYWLEKLKKEKLKPEFVLLDNSVEAYNLDAFIKIDEVLVNGLDFSFVFRHYKRYSSEEITNFIAKRLFRTYQYRPNLKIVLERMKNNFAILNNYRNFRNQIREKLLKERGSVSPNVSGNVASPPELINEYAEGDFHSYLEVFRFNENMWRFQADNALLLNEMKIPYAIVWVRLAPSYFELIKNKKIKIEGEMNTVHAYWKKKKKKIYKQYNAHSWNMNEDPDYSCDYFGDASHMSLECYPAYTDYLFDKISKFPNESRE